MHELDVVLPDLALRCCHLTVSPQNSLRLKVGDYGLAPASFLQDYVSVGGEQYPVRWMPPELLKRLRVLADEREDDEDKSEDGEAMPKILSLRREKADGIWSLAITLWEVLTTGSQLPFSEISDHQFVNFAISHSNLLTAPKLLEKVHIRVRKTNSRLHIKNSEIRSSTTYIQCPTVNEDSDNMDFRPLWTPFLG